MFILLPLTEGEIPETAEKRKIIIQEICREAGRYGLTKDDFVVDGLVMTVASNPQAAAEALKTVQWCTEKFKCRTILGLSNVSFGMPERKWINATFLAMAQALGLTMAIVNPASEELMNIRRAGDVLMQNDRDAAAYIRYFAKPSDSQTAPAVDQEAPPLKVFRAILEGNREDIIPLVDEALSLEMTAARLIDDIMIPAIIQVGNLFDKKTYFLPQLIASAEAMRKGVNHLEPKLRAKTGGLRQRGLVLLATVEGDIHDIGKNIVALMLKNHGYKIIDLGKDVSAEIIIQNMRKMKPDVVGLSALMTTTMVNMKNVIEKAARAGLAGRFLLGGAVLTQAYADSIGAAYARDGVEAVRVVERMMKK
jgi:5-methyltetrahydrofolate--homocysteine methyltransferase